MQKGLQKTGHAEFISASRCLEKEEILNQVQDDKKGFTLIELLVVVLIIGILAAVALPQYQKAVLKTRLSKYILLGKTIQHAQNAYLMENGKYAQSFQELDLDFSNVCSSLSQAGHVIFNCQDPIAIDNENFGASKDVVLWYSPSVTPPVEDYHDFMTTLPYIRIAISYETGKISCESSDNTLRRICLKLVV